MTRQGEIEYLIMDLEKESFDVGKEMDDKKKDKENENWMTRIIRCCLTLKVIKVLFGHESSLYLVSSFLSCRTNGDF